MADQSEDSSEFDQLISALASDPQFAAQSVMEDSLSHLMPEMNETQQVAVRKMIAQFARVLNEAGMLVERKVQ